MPGNNWPTSSMHLITDRNTNTVLLEMLQRCYYSSFPKSVLAILQNSISEPSAMLHTDEQQKFQQTMEVKFPTSNVRRRYMEYVPNVYHSMNCVDQ